MQKFYWNNPGAPPPPPGSCHAGYRDTRDKGPQPHHQGPGHNYHQTLTLAINSNNQPQDYTYIQQTNNRRAIKTNEAVNIKNNDNEFSSSQHAAKTQSDTQNSIRVQNSEIKNTAKTIHLNSSNDYYIKVNGNKQCIQVNQSYLKDAACNTNFQGSCSNRVVLKLGDISPGPGHGAGSVSSELNQRSHIPTQSRWRVNKTWNENMKGKYRQSIQAADIFKHDYENVYDNTKPVSDAKTESKKDSRQTPRSRKKSKHPGNVYRSKSCERVAGVIDRLSEKLSISGLEAEPARAPPTPTPSLLHSKLARAIPCVDIKPGCVSSGGRSSPTESLAYEGVEGPFRPAQSLADRMRGRLEYVNKKMKIIRSRSAERIRGVIRSDLDLHEADDLGPAGERPGRSREPVRMRQAPGSDQSEAGTRSQLTNQTAVGQARALVSCVPSPYDRDVLGFQAGDIIDVLQMNQNGLWRGRCRDRVGTFKFINVELLPTRRRKRSSSRSLRKMRASQSRPPGNIGEVMRILDMAEHLPVFVLNGYEDLTLFKDLDDDELDYLGITNLKQRQKLIDMANLLFPDEKSLGGGDSSDDGSDSEDSSSESGIADINSDEAYSSYNSSKHN